MPPGVLPRSLCACGMQTEDLAETMRQMCLRSEHEHDPASHGDGHGRGEDGSHEGQDEDDEFWSQKGIEAGRIESGASARFG